MISGFTFNDNFRQQAVYTAIFLVLLVPAAATHNMLLVEGEDTTTIGFCNASLACNGYEAGGVCIGLEREVLNCMDPRGDHGEAEAVNYAEVECALQAYKLCDQDGVTGTAWASDASYKNKTCQAWHDEDGAGLIHCKNTYPPLEYPEPGQ